MKSYSTLLTTKSRHKVGHCSVTTAEAGVLLYWI